MELLLRQRESTVVSSLQKQGSRQIKEIIFYLDFRFRGKDCFTRTLRFGKNKIIVQFRFLRILLSHVE